MKYNITYNDLDIKFPGFIWWSSVLEIVGINFNTKQLLIIDDGLCCNEDSKKWMVHGYQLDTIPSDWRSLKYCASENKILEKWINFKDNKKIRLISNESK